MAENRDEVLKFASDLKSQPLDAIERNWIDSLLHALFALCSMSHEDEVVSIMVLESCKTALRHLVRRRRFPTSFYFVTCQQLSSLGHAVKCDFSRAWEISTEESQPRYGPKTKKRSIQREWRETGRLCRPFCALQSRSFSTNALALFTQIALIYFLAMFHPHAMLTKADCLRPFLKIDFAAMDSFPFRRYCSVE